MTALRSTPFMHMQPAARPRNLEDHEFERPKSIDIRPSAGDTCSSGMPELFEGIEALGKQCMRISVLYHATLLQNDDPIEIHNPVQTMCHRDDGVIMEPPPPPPMSALIVVSVLASMLRGCRCSVSGNAS